MFVRFVVGSDGQHHKELTGIITEARLLRERGELTTDEEDLLEDLYEWFNEHVPVPPFESRRLPRDAVAWFRDDAGEPVAKMWDIVALLREHGVDVRLLGRRILAESSMRIGCRCSLTSGTGSSQAACRSAAMRGDQGFR